MFKRLQGMEEEYNNIKEQLMEEKVLSNFEKTKELNKKLKSMEDIISCYLSYKKLAEEKNELTKLLEDEEFKNTAIEELSKVEENQRKIIDSLEKLLMPKDENDEKNVIVEIRGAAGGDEANIFAGDLYEMYEKYASKFKWKIEILNEIRSIKGGYSQIEFLIKGKGAYSKLKYESGAHRVQRVPDTESRGRVHTSTSTVIVMPEQENINIEIKEQDLKIDVYRSSGAGGQSVNTTDSAVRITHLPTNITVTCQNERSQIQNREKALQLLKNKIYEEERIKKEEKEHQEKKIKIGTGDRSEKIRTYNYPQNRVTDHRINYTSMQLDRIMEGDLEEIIEALEIENQKRKLEQNG